MDTNESKTKPNKWLAIMIAPLALALAGCDVKVSDLTPSSMRANPSNTYTIIAQIVVKNSAVMEGSLRPEVIVDGISQSMALAPGSESLYELDYKMPPGRNAATYYILVRYDRKTSADYTKKEIFTGLATFSVEGRYSVELEVDRAPVGSKIAILGRGFSAEDKVTVGGSPAATLFESSTSLAFYVPSIPNGRNYEVKVHGAGGEMSAGFLRVDASQIGVTPSSLSLGAGTRRPLVFNIPEIAPPGGLPIRVTTDIPSSIIMPDVVIPAGQRSTSITVQGGQPGSGSLFIEVPGYAEVVIPVSVN